LPGNTKKLKKNAEALLETTNEDDVEKTQRELN
jgi:hypothetical protein